MAAAAVRLMPELAGEHRGLPCTAQSKEKCFPGKHASCCLGAVFALDRYQVGAVSFCGTAACRAILVMYLHVARLTKFLGRFYSTHDLSASAVHLTLISCFSCHTHLSCKRFIWGRKHPVFLTAVCSGKQGRFTEHIQVSCTVSTTDLQMQQNTVQGAHVEKKSHLSFCPGKTPALLVVTVMTLKQFWGAAFHVWTMLPEHLLYWGARNSSSVPVDTYTGRNSFPQLVEL